MICDYLNMKTEEPGVNLPDWESGDPVASVPIKKRRIPLVRSPSPPPQISSSSSPPEEPDKPQKIQSSTAPELLPVTAGSTEKVSGVIVTNKGCSSEDSMPVGNLSLTPGNETPVGVDFKERTFSISAGNETKSDLKLMSDSKSAFHRVQGNTELLLAPKGTFVSFTGEDVNREGKLMLSDRYAIPEVLRNTQLPLQMDGSSGSLRDVQNNVVKLEPLMWDLSKSCSGVDPGMLKDMISVEGQIKLQSKGNEFQMKFDSTHLHTNRSHWDLNTTMDTWDGSLSREAIRPGGSGGLDLIGTCEQKSLICPVEMLLREPERTTDIAGKRILDETRNSFELSNMSTFPNKQLYSFHPQLDTSSDFLSSFSQNLTSPSPKLNSQGESSDLSLSMNLLPLADNQKMVEHRTVKSEPCEEGRQLDSRTVETGKLKVVDPKFVKAELSDGVGHKVVKRAGLNNLKSVDHRVVKPEPFVDNGGKNLNKAKGISSHLEILTSTTKNYVDGVVTQEASEIVGNASTLASEFMNSDVRESTVSATMLDSTQMTVSDGMLDSTQITCSDGKSSILNSVDELHLDPYANSYVAQNVEDTIKISSNILEENPCGTCDNESDGPHGAVGAMDAEFKRQYGDDEYEDGEVRESLVHSAIEGIFEEGEAVPVDSGDLAGKEVHNSGSHRDENVLASSHLEGKNGMIENPSEIKSTQCSGEVDNALCIEKSDQGIKTIPNLQKSSTIEVPSAGSVKKRVGKIIRRIPKERPGKEDLMKGPAAELGSDQAINTIQGTATEGDQGGPVSQQGNVKRSNAVEAMLPKLKSSVNNNKDIKDANGRVSRSRIINLGHTPTPNGSSAGRTSFIPGRSLSLQGEREKLYDISTRGDKSHPRGSRDEKMIGGLHKFERMRNHDQAVGNSGSDYMYGRRRVDDRLDSLHGNQESGWDYTTGLRFPRPKHAAAVSPTKFEFDNFVLAPDGTFVTSVRPGRKLVINELRPGRKLVNNGLQSLRLLPSRRRSPGRREEPMPLGVQMVRRSPREINAERCIRGDPDLVLLRHEEKLLRTLPDDMVDPLFSRRPPYERVENPFIRRGRSFSPIERRGSLHLPHIRSKSPPRDRAPSPCPWSSPRGRSPDGFDACSELTHCLSPPIFRVERIESPHQRPCFPEEMIRRHGSPSTPFLPRLPNDMIDIGTSREHDHPRPFIPNRRSPSGRILRRLPRRFDVIEPRERADADEYFGPLHSRQFHELPGDEFHDERRKGRERHGPLVSIRSYDMGDDVDNFRYDVEDGPRPVRFCPEADAEFHERGNLRNFDGHIKNRTGNISRRQRTIEERRQRTIEEQEDSYRCGGQEWDGSVFNEIVRPKRRRF